MSFNRGADALVVVRGILFDEALFRAAAGIGRTPPELFAATEAETGPFELGLVCWVDIAQEELSSPATRVFCLTVNFAKPPAMVSLSHRDIL